MNVDKTIEFNRRKFEDSQEKRRGHINDRAWANAAKGAVSSAVGSALLTGAFGRFKNLKQMGQSAALGGGATGIFSGLSTKGKGEKYLNRREDEFSRRVELYKNIHTPTQIKTAKAESKSQQRLMGMVHAYQKGELENFKDLPKDLQSKIKEMAMDMSKKETKDYAETKHKGLPEKTGSIRSKIYKYAPNFLRNKMDIPLQNTRTKLKQMGTAKSKAKASVIDADLQAGRLKRDAKMQSKKIKDLETENLKMTEQNKKMIEEVNAARNAAKQDSQKSFNKLLAAAGATGAVGGGAGVYALTRSNGNQTR